MDDSVDAGTVGDAGPTATLALPREARSQRRQRRPSGAPPPHPRKLGTSGKVWLLLGAVALVNIVWIPIVGQPRSLARFETAVLADVADFRAGWLTTILDGLSTTGSRWAPTVLGWATIGVLAALRRWRHLFVFLGSMALLSIVGGIVYENVARPRPVGVDIIGHWGGFAMPSPPVATLTTILLGMAYSLVVAGRPRQLAKAGVAAVIGVFALARLYLAVDHPSDILYGVVLGVAIPLVLFRLFVPNEVFPVAYRRGKKAHLDVTGERGDAIRRATRSSWGSSCSTCNRWAWPVRADPRPCACTWPATRTPMSSPSSTPRVTSGPTGGTSSAARSSMGPSRTRLPSTPSGGWSSTRTTPFGCCVTSASPPPPRTASSRSRPSRNTCWSPPSSRTPRRSATPRSKSR